MQMEQLRPHKAISPEIKAPGTELSPDEFTQMGFGDSDDPAGAVCVCMWHFPPAEFTLRQTKNERINPDCGYDCVSINILYN